MSKLVSRLLSPGNVLLAVALVTATGGYALAGDKIGNGGSIWACMSGKTLSQGYLLDLYEAREEFFLTLAPPTSTEPLKIAGNLSEKLAREWPEFSEQIQPHMHEVLKSMRLVNTGLIPIPDSEPHVYPLPETCKGGSWGQAPLQMANYKEDGALLIRKDLWQSRNLAALDKGALIWHEAVYRWRRAEYRDQNSSRARHIVGLLFSTLPIEQSSIEIEKIIADGDVHPTPGPTPVPAPTPQPTPRPTPMPTPIPTPTPTPEPPVILCLVDNGAAAAVYGGYGPTEFLSRTSAKSACMSGPQAFACSDTNVECEKLGPTVDWTCTTSNRQSGQFFVASGRSKLEAQFKAQTACFGGGGMFAQACESRSFMDCASN